MERMHYQPEINLTPREPSPTLKRPQVLFSMDNLPEQNEGQERRSRVNLIPNFADLSPQEQAEILNIPRMAGGDDDVAAPERTQNTQNENRAASDVLTNAEREGQRRTAEQQRATRNPDRPDDEFASLEPGLSDQEYARAAMTIVLTFIQGDPEIEQINAFKNKLTARAKADGHPTAISDALLQLNSSSQEKRRFNSSLEAQAREAREFRMRDKLNRAFREIDNARASADVDRGGIQTARAYLKQIRAMVKSVYDSSQEGTGKTLELNQQTLELFRTLVNTEANGNGTDRIDSMTIDQIKAMAQPYKGIVAKFYKNIETTGDPNTRRPNNLEDIAEAITTQFTGEYGAGQRYSLIKDDGSVNTGNMLIWLRDQIIKSMNNSPDSNVNLLSIGIQVPLSERVTIEAIGTTGVFQQRRKHIFSGKEDTNVTTVETAEADPAYNDVAGNMYISSWLTQTSHNNDAYWRSSVKSDKQLDGAWARVHENNVFTNNQRLLTLLRTPDVGPAVLKTILAYRYLPEMANEGGRNVVFHGEQKAYFRKVIGEEGMEKFFQSIVVQALGYVDSERLIKEGSIGSITPLSDFKKQYSDFKKNELEQQIEAARARNDPKEERRLEFILAEIQRNGISNLEFFDQKDDTEAAKAMKKQLRDELAKKLVDSGVGGIANADFDKLSSNTEEAAFILTQKLMNFGKGDINIFDKQKKERKIITLVDTAIEDAVGFNLDTINRQMAGKLGRSFRYWTGLAGDGDTTATKFWPDTALRGEYRQKSAEKRGGAGNLQTLDNFRRFGLVTMWENIKVRLTNAVTADEVEVYLDEKDEKAGKKASKEKVNKILEELRSDDYKMTLLEAMEGQIKRVVTEGGHERTEIIRFKRPVLGEDNKPMLDEKGKVQEETYLPSFEFSSVAQTHLAEVVLKAQLDLHNLVMDKHELGLHKMFARDPITGKFLASHSEVKEILGDIMKTFRYAYDQQGFLWKHKERTWWWDYKKDGKGNDEINPETNERIRRVNFGERTIEEIFFNDEVINMGMYDRLELKKERETDYSRNAFAVFLGKYLLEHNSEFSTQPDILEDRLSLMRTFFRVTPLTVKGVNEHGHTVYKGNTSFFTPKEFGKIEKMGHADLRSQVFHYLKLHTPHDVREGLGEGLEAIWKGITNIKLR